MSEHASSDDARDRARRVGADGALRRSPATIAVTAGRPAPAPEAPMNTPIVVASTYHLGGELTYGRFGNPTWAALEEALGALEGGTAVTFSSGMAAVTAVLSLLPDGVDVVVPRHAYHGTLSLARRLEAQGRLRLRPVDVADRSAVLRAIPGAALVWLESPTNPALEVADVATLARAGREAGALVVVDNTFATPLLQQPLRLGADIALHSATKYLAGHSDAVLGATVSAPDIAGRLLAHRGETGSIPGVLEAYLALRGLRTLHLRVERAQSNARELAERLAGHRAVERVRYPGFGAILAVEVAGGAVAADQVCREIRLWVHATSLGGVESSLERRRAWLSEAPTIPEQLLRLSVGIEDVDDLWADLDAALVASLASG